MHRRAFPPQWHLRIATVGGVKIQAHANVERAWRLATGEGTTIAVIDDGVDVDHEEFSAANKIVAPRSFGKVSSDDPRPGEGDDHGTAAAGVACADGRFGASGVAPARPADAAAVVGGPGQPGRGRRVRLGGRPRGRRHLVQLGSGRRPLVGPRRPAARPGRPAARQHPPGHRLRGAQPGAAAAAA